MIKDFLATASYLARNGKLSELLTFIALTWELTKEKIVTITAGKPVDKE